ncbi:DNA photolyase, FAD-binding/Cryptochrome [Leucosporidium creatinivorum]|uniref:DNA photolyase, FAD-binding/Cryptochrome n=1 Tax=Leucosporidium creatinivorum TaxID=106004 RepID=A0A1Y2CZJ0_9BASI|nr:DNA photolyase, FAD-binding/Cryptochrome [Leucosporidium creatinivorum]
MLQSSELKPVKHEKDSVVVYWMRNKDLRLTDNRALAHASGVAKTHSLPLIVLYVFSPSDYAAHDRSPRRIDFQVRQLRYLSAELAKLDIPLYTIEWSERKSIPSKLLEKLEEWNASALIGNLEYEIDELRRDTEIVQKTNKARKGGEGWKGETTFLADFCVVPPGEVLTKQDKPYSVFSPWYRNWSAKVSANPLDYIDDAGGVEANDKSARNHPVLKPMFEHKVPEKIKGWSLDAEDQKNMEHLWPVGEGVCEEVMRRFLKTKVRKQAFFEPPLHPGAQDAKDPKKDSKIGEYATGRNNVSLDGTSHISPYLAAGFISPRHVLRLTAELSNNKLPTDKSTGNGLATWISEVAWRDFYQHVLCAWPRVSMGRPFNLKYENVVWEHNDEHFQAWKDGRTGFPIVDAAMRALKAQGYMHNRCRMIVAMLFTKQLMLDWHLGERYFMEQLLDGDLGANNGGWQWSASTGCDPQPYFRIFNMTSQSEKSDPDGDYIRYWVPELKSLKGKAIHEPSASMSEKEILKLGYVMPIVDHATTRKRALARYKE